MTYWQHLCAGLAVFVGTLLAVGIGYQMGKRVR